MKTGTLFSVVTICVMCASLQETCFAADKPTVPSSKKNTRHSSSRKSQHNRYALVPPPPPTAVSPTVLAAYPQTMGSSVRLMPPKPHHLADDMRLTAVMDNIAFFRIHGGDESVHLTQGKTYQTVTVAQITPDEVVLEEKGKQFIKHLR